MRLHAIAALAAIPVAAGFELVVNPLYKQNSNDTANSVPLDLSSLRNNRGFGLRPGDADFDGTGASYPAQFLPSADFVYSGVRFDFPQYHKDSGNDNVLAQGQSLSVPPGRYSSLHIFAAGDTDSTTGSLDATYADNSTSSSALLVPPYWSWPYPFGGDLVFPYRISNETVDYNRSMVFHSTHWLDASKELSSVALPDLSSAKPGKRMHVFAVSLVAAGESDGPHLEIVHARSTQTWLEGTNKTQIFEAVLTNPGTETISAPHGFDVSVEAEGVKTVQPGKVYRLRPGDQARVQVGVELDGEAAEGTAGRATVVVSGSNVHLSHEFDATLGIAAYEPTFESTYAHEAPPWFSNGKFGIFVHWGVYSVPAWGNVGDNESYAEWYWWNMNSGPTTIDDTYDYHRETYGENVVYDDFIANFTASAFDPREWVDLFADSGAQYFVITSKHHDGYALFDLPANVSQRTSVALPPHRHLLREVFEAAERYQPQLHHATYFSLPEWFHPDYASLGFDSWPGGNATNPYTGEVLPYTGYVPVDDFVNDIIAPEMLALADLGTEILWCDIGGPNATAEVAAAYFNDAAADGRQVLTNNRCGAPGDFDTPEYARYDSIQARKWESSMGMDPFSYGYNRATPAATYMTGKDVVTSLVDIISKNGNFLLDIGPKEDGTILDVEKNNLRDAGRWIHSHAEAVFNTTYWFVAPEDGDAVRFTQTPEAFYIVAINTPNTTLALNQPVPYVDGDEITVVGGNKSGAVVPSRRLEDGRLELSISDEIRDADEYAWVFKISYVA